MDMRASKLGEDVNLVDVFAEVGVLTPISEENRPKDNVGNPIPCDFVLKTRNIGEAARIAVENDFRVIVRGALTSGNQSFGPPGAVYDPNIPILLIEPIGVASDSEVVNSEVGEKVLDSNQLSICRDKLGADRHTIRGGAGVTVEQVNQLLAKKFDPTYYVPLDYTTVASAFAGGVFAAGAMGPSRIHPYEVIRSLVISDGNDVRRYTDPEEIKNLEGLLGLNGAILEIEFEVFRRPVNQFAFSVPLKDVGDSDDWTEKASQVLAALYPACKTRFENGKIVSDWQGGFVNGIEIITKKELEMVAKKTAVDEVKRKAKLLIKEMEEGNSTFSVYVTGFSNAVVSEDENDGNPVFGLLELEDAGVLGTASLQTDIVTLKALREAIPEFAREEASRGFSKSTDVNTTVSEGASPENLQALFREMLLPYFNFEGEIRELAEKEGVEINVRRYGHLNPRNIDPHTRVTYISNPEKTTEENRRVLEEIKVIRARLDKAIEGLMVRDDIVVSHGEKGKLQSRRFMSPEAVSVMDNLINGALDAFNFRVKQQTLLKAAA